MNRQLHLYADGIKPDKAHIEKLLEQGITGCTCNPSLAKAYVNVGWLGEEYTSYEGYSKFLINHFYPHPVSIQVLEPTEEQVRKIASWGENVYVKIPVIDEKGESTAPLIVKMLNEGIKINVTAIFTQKQVIDLMQAGLTREHDCIISVFCGRIADTQRSAESFIVAIAAPIDWGGRGKIKLLWAGVRSAGDIRSAEKYCDIITIPQAVLDKLPLKDKNLEEYCLETVQMFARDAENFTI